MFRYNHNSRCAECTRFHAINNMVDEGYVNHFMPSWMHPTIFLCRDCWYNEDVK